MERILSACLKDARSGASATGAGRVSDGDCMGEKAVLKIICFG
jgi:hypothetical protein